MLSRILSWFGVTMDVVTREQVALDILGRTYRLKHSPVILTDPPEQGQEVAAQRQHPSLLN